MHNPNILSTNRYFYQSLSDFNHWFFRSLHICLVLFCWLKRKEKEKKSFPKGYHHDMVEKCNSFVKPGISNLKHVSHNFFKILLKLICSVWCYLILTRHSVPRGLPLGTKWRSISSAAVDITIPQKCSKDKHWEFYQNGFELGLQIFTRGSVFEELSVGVKSRA